MNDGMSTTGWIVLICLVGIILIFNFGLIAALSGKRQMRHPFEPFIRVKNGVLHPWKNEDDQINELKRRVDALKNPPPHSSDDAEDHPPANPPLI